MTALANTLLSLLSTTTQESVAANINAEFINVNDCNTWNITEINEKFNVVGATYKRIETELAEVVNSVALLGSNYDETTQKVVNRGDVFDNNSAEVAVAQSSFALPAKSTKFWTMS